jgi:putative Holliday junction resolvase
LNYLGLDWGEKRIGLAYADSVGVAVPLPAAIARSKEERLRYIESIIETRKIDAIVCGYPINMDGSTGFKAREVDKFILEIEGRFGLPVHRTDERLSSYSVEQVMKQQKKQIDRKSGVIDSRAATLILQDFIEAQTIFNENNEFS